MQIKFLNIDYLKVFRFIFIFTFIFFIFIIFYFPNYSKLKKLKQANKKLSLEIEKLEKEIKDLKEKIEKVKSKDPSFYEKIAREELGVAKENEIIIDIEK
jgi:cell division protein FtsB